MVLVRFLPLLLFGLMAHEPRGKTHAEAQAAAERINRLASPESINSEDSAKLYIDAFADAWGLNDPSFRNLKTRLAHAEVLAIRDDGTRVSVEAIAKSFNKLMGQLGSPKEMRITGEEVQRFRRNFFKMTQGSFPYPNMPARGSGGSLDDRCRPVEALYLIFLLQYGPNIEASQSKISTPPRADMILAVRPLLQSASARQMEYSVAVDLYFRKHSTREFAETFNSILDDLLGGPTENSFGTAH